ncbi:hypothetical protein D0T92_08090 [Neisseria zalophi]|uniref:Uncharacterized protein n=1 Tax=Neisseria zalophi TaxID=640030 RepID=A0A5J6Q002_9NEIS|nr:hypothetical protein D0T92_08090 [Neisseria zalophi]
MAKSYASIFYKNRKHIYIKTKNNLIYAIVFNNQVISFIILTFIQPGRLKTISDGLTSHPFGYDKNHIC